MAWPGCKRAIHLVLSGKLSEVRSRKSKGDFEGSVET